MARGLFFATYIFLIWFYSHKLKKYTLFGNFLLYIRFLEFYCSIISDFLWMKLKTTRMILP